MRWDLEKLGWKTPAQIYVQRRASERREFERYFSSDRMNALQLALRISRYRQCHGVDFISRLYVISTVAEDLKFSMPKISWEYFNEALVLFELYQAPSFRDSHENLYDHKMRHNGISKRARRLVRFMKQKRKETDRTYFRRMNRSKIAKTILFLTAAYDMNPKHRPADDNFNRKVADLQARNIMNHLNLTREMWDMLHSLSFRMGLQAAKLAEDAGPRHLRVTFERATGITISRLGYQFTELALLTKENRELIRHSTDTCKKCKKEKLVPEKVREFEGHTVFVIGRLAQQIILQFPWFWETEDALYDSMELNSELIRRRRPREENWFKLEFYKQEGLFAE